MAYDMLNESLISADEALTRVDANRLEELFKPRVDEEACAEQGIEPIATGLNASPGAATGKVVFTADDAQAWGSRDEAVILVRRETTPDDYHGMIASKGILTSAGGTNSHAAVVARGEGIPAGVRRRCDQARRRGEDVLGQRHDGRRRARSSRSTGSRARCSWGAAAEGVRAGGGAIR
jgi:phosphoenolpyruvate synthase/pyruvate phosphate dikinase